MSLLDGNHSKVYTASLMQEYSVMKVLELTIKINLIENEVSPGKHRIKRMKKWQRSFSEFSKLY